jgi:hypothetical protein
MNRILLAALALVASGPVCFGQTNAPATANLSPPRPALQSPAEPKESAPASSMQASNVAAAGHTALAAESAASAAVTRFEGISPAQTNGPIYNIDLERAPSFKPKISHIGRAEFYSSVSTAVARKNPLCLLDPHVLELSW